MNPEKRDLYKITWSQSYPAQPLEDAMHELNELLIEASDYEDAKEVLAKIMAKK